MASSKTAMFSASEQTAGFLASQSMPWDFPVQILEPEPVSELTTHIPTYLTY